MERYDICVIGGGPSGYAATMRALDFDLKVCLIESNKIGGAGLYDGALSSKTLWELSKDVMNTRSKMEKYSRGCAFTLDFAEIKKELNSAVKERATMLEGQLQSLEKCGYAGKFKLKYGRGKLVTKNEVEITNSEGAKETIQADNIILATGSRPRKIPTIPIDENIIVTSDGIHHWDKLPESMVVLGAGVIGCEYATIFSNFGLTDVRIIDKADRILPFEDEDVANMIEKSFTKSGVNIHRNSQLVRMDIVDGMVEYELKFKDDTHKVYKVEKALVSIGRVPNLEGLGLEDVGIELNERGQLIERDTQTTVSNIYAVGDITADISLVNVGELEARYAVKKIMGKAYRPLEYNNVSTIMFLNPPVAGVGMNEQQAKAKGIQYKVVSIDYNKIPRAIAMRNPPGFFKIIVTNDTTMRVLGMRAVGPHATSAIQGVALLIKLDLGVEEIAELIHPHPSLVEGIQECMRMLLGKSIYKPHIFRDSMKCCWWDGKQFYNLHEKDIENCEIDFDDK